MKKTNPKLEVSAVRQHYAEYIRKHTKKILEEANGKGYSANPSDWWQGDAMKILAHGMEMACQMLMNPNIDMDYVPAGKGGETPLPHGVPEAVEETTGSEASIQHNDSQYFFDPTKSEPQEGHQGMGCPMHHLWKDKK